MRWASILALFFLALSVIKMIQSIWALLQGELIKQSSLEKAELVFRWLGIVEFSVFCFLTIALSFTLAYTTDS
jgi:hypothetical protein